MTIVCRAVEGDSATVTLDDLMWDSKSSEQVVLAGLGVLKRRGWIAALPATPDTYNLTELHTCDIHCAIWRRKEKSGTGPSKRVQKNWATNDLHRAVRARDLGLCRYCGDASDLTIDHLDPGGGDSMANLVTACGCCNSAKNKRTPKQSRMILLPIGTKLHYQRSVSDEDMRALETELRSILASTGTTQAYTMDAAAVVKQLRRRSTALFYDRTNRLPNLKLQIDLAVERHQNAVAHVAQLAVPLVKTAA